MFSNFVVNAYSQGYIQIPRSYLEVRGGVDRSQRWRRGVGGGGLRMIIFKQINPHSIPQWNQQQQWHLWTNNRKREQPGEDIRIRQTVFPGFSSLFYKKLTTETMSVSVGQYKSRNENAREIKRQGSVQQRFFMYYRVASAIFYGSKEVMALLSGERTRKRE